MPTHPSQQLLSEEDYDAISSAVMETARGRWFLAEYARRNRSSDTDQVLKAIERLETSMEGRTSGGVEDRIRLDIVDMANAIARTKAEIAAVMPPDQQGHIGDASNELDAIVRSTETATGEILAAAEHLQEVAWTLREQGYQGAACEIIDQRATDIYTACSFQDITGQRTQKVIQVLRYLEDRLNAMVAIWGGGEAAAPVPAFKPKDSLVNGPAPPGQELAQSVVDRMMAFEAQPLTIDHQPLAIEHEPLALAPPLDIPAAPAPLLIEASPPAIEPAPLVLEALPVPPAIEVSPEPAAIEVSPASLAALAESPFSPPVRPKPRIAEKTLVKARPAPARSGPGPVTVSEIEALPFEERAALFS